MTFLLYTPLMDDVGKRLLEVLYRTNLDGQIEIVQTMEGLHQRLRKFFQKPSVIILRAINKQNIQDLLSEKKVMGDAFIILILPARDENILSLGHRFSPRFIAFADSAFGDVASVLKKIQITRAQEKQPAPKG